MKADGFSQEQQKCLFYYFRRGFVQCAERQMNECADEGIINSSDVRLIRLAIQQTGLAAAKLGKRGVMGAFQLTSFLLGTLSSRSRYCHLASVSSPSHSLILSSPSRLSIAAALTSVL